MRFSLSALALMSLATSLTAAPTARTPDTGEGLPDGLPNPSPSQLKVIEQNAHGTLPNGPPPPVISNRGILNLKLIAFNELFEVAFFSELITNITENVDGYQFTDDDDRTKTLSWLKVILAQEELHAIRANDALSHFGVKGIEPCQYKFPVADFDSAIALAMTFTDVVLGTLQDVVEIFAIGRDVDLAREIASVIGQEGEQQGWFRVTQDKVPSELPFLTTSDINFAFTAIQGFVVPGTCPNIRDIDLRTYETLNILTPPAAQSQNLTFSFSDTRNETTHPLWMTYINQQNLPIVEPLHVTSREGDVVTAQALFPYDDNEMNGLTIAAVTLGEGPFGDASSVAQWTLAGPGLIIVN